MDWVDDILLLVLILAATEKGKESLNKKGVTMNRLLIFLCLLMIFSLSGCRMSHYYAEPDVMIPRVNCVYNEDRYRDTEGIRQRYTETNKGAHYYEESRERQGVV
jgi:hypothetical protein